MTKVVYIISSVEIKDGKKQQHLVGGCKVAPSTRYGSWRVYKTKEEAMEEANYLAETFGGTYHIEKKTIETEDVITIEKKYRICEFCKYGNIESVDALSGTKYYSCDNGWNCKKINRFSPCGYFEEKQ